MCEGSESKREERKCEAPDPDSAALADIVALLGFAVQRGDLCIGVSSAAGATPPLVEAVHGGIVKDHWRIEQVDFLAGLAEADAELVVFGGDDFRAEAAEGAEDFRTHHEDAAAGAESAGLLTPFEIEEAVVDGGFRMDFANVAADNSGVGTLTEGDNSLLEPAIGEGAVAIDELEEFGGWEKRVGSGEALVAGARGGEGRLHFDDMAAERASKAGTAVHGAGIDIDHGLRKRNGSAQAAFEPLALVAPDGDDGNVLDRVRSHGLQF